MVRVARLPVEELNPLQKRIHDEIASTRDGYVAGVYPIWLRTPELADIVNRMGDALRVHGRLDKRLFELAVLAVARHWSAAYEWFAHEKPALDAGLAREVVEALRQKSVPQFTREDERLVYEVVTELHEAKAVSQATYDRAVAGLGLENLVELITAIGLYSTIAMMINTFDVTVPKSRPRPW
jgi:4-carboxymuconolactone decarboxylase